MTRLVMDALPARGRVLEAGCGPGHQVVLLRRTGHQAFGTDFSWQAVRQCRAADPAAPVSVMDLRALGFAPESFSCYVSLGVVEHDPDGPDAILREARRVLEPAGVIVLSVPYVNALRRLGTWWIRHRNQQIRKVGALFYQFAFSREEGEAFLERNGFRVLRATPYDPARMLRRAWRHVGGRLRVGRGRYPDVKRAGGDPAGGTSSRSPHPYSGSRQLLRRLLYTRVCLRVLGHMILFVAVKR